MMNGDVKNKEEIFPTPCEDNTLNQLIFVMLSHEFD